MSSKRREYKVDDHAKKAAVCEAKAHHSSEDTVTVRP
jgi:hypothetical protein